MGGKTGTSRGRRTRWWGRGTQRTCGAALAAFALSGCATVEWDGSWPEPRPLGRGLETYRPPRAPGPRPAAGAAVEPTGVLQLADARALALLHSPRLAAFAWNVRAHEARTFQAGRAPNPQLSFAMDDVLGDDAFRGVESAETTLRLAQRFEPGGKRAHRRRVAGLDEDAAGWRYEAERLEVLSDVAGAFATLLASQERLALVDDLVAIAEASVATVEREIEEGLASPLEGTRARVDLAEARVERERTHAELQTARSELAAAWGSEQERFDRAEGDLEAVAEPPGLATLLARVDANPDLARFASEVERRRAALALERAKRIPDVTVGAGVRRISATTDTALVFGFDVPLGVADRNRGGILAARYELARAEEEHRAARLRVRTRLAAADDRLQGAWREITALRREVLPDAEAVHREILAEFDGGRFSYDDVLDAQRTLFRLRGRYLEALEAWHVAAAEVERLIGAPLHGP